MEEVFAGQGVLLGLGFLILGFFFHAYITKTNAIAASKQAKAILAENGFRGGDGSHLPDELGDRADTSTCHHGDSGTALLDRSADGTVGNDTHQLVCSGRRSLGRHPGSFFSRFQAHLSGPADRLALCHTHHLSAGDCARGVSTLFQAQSSFLSL